MQTDELSTPEEAVQAGVNAGWSHANYYAAYRSTGVPISVDVPGKYEAHADHYADGYNEGVDLFNADRYPDGSHVYQYMTE